MHPAASVIIFTVLSGAGFGLLAALGLGLTVVAGWQAFLLWGLGYALSVIGLLASTFHLGNPQRALLAFTQWRTSWLSREGWASVVTLTLLAPVALGAWLGFPVPWLGVAGAVGCAVAVLCTSMIYAQLATVPRWNHWMTPVSFFAFALAGGAILSGQRLAAILLCLALAPILIAGWRIGDAAFAARGVTLGSATGLGRIGTPRVFEQPHTGGNYLTREMIHIVGRKHVQRLRVIAVALAAVLPVLVLLVAGGPVACGLAALLHLTGALAARWLFFAQAEHVVGLYYGRFQASR